MAAGIPRPKVGYLGWSGRGNLGDDVLLEVVAEALPDAEFVPLPMTMAEIARAGVSGISRRRQRPLVLGGGTAVGRRNWRAALQAATISCGAEHHLIGVGVEDPRFQGKHSFSGGGELARWVPHLRRFESVTVRGPNSASLLANVGVAAEVVGDPALLLDPHFETGAATVGHGWCGISLGYGDDLWGHDHAVVTSTVAAAAAHRVRAGQQIVFLIVNPHDEIYAREVAASLPTGSYRYERPLTSAAFFEAVRDCSVVIAERLHAGILAIRAGVPTVMLEYQPKVRDFMDSVQLGHLSARVDRLSQGLLLEMVNFAVEDSADHALIASRVADLRKRLGREVERLANTVRLRLESSMARSDR